MSLCAISFPFFFSLGYLGGRRSLNNYQVYISSTEDICQRRLAVLSPIANFQERKCDWPSVSQVHRLTPSSVSRIGYPETGLAGDAHPHGWPKGISSRKKNKVQWANIYKRQISYRYRKSGNAQVGVLRNNPDTGEISIICLTSWVIKNLSRSCIFFYSSFLAM